MFKTLSGLTDNAFWRVSADTKTCGSPLYLHLLAVYVSLLANMQPNRGKNSSLMFGYAGTRIRKVLLAKLNVV